MSPLTEQDIQQALRDLPGWERDGERLVLAVDLGDFKRAMAFLVRVAFEAESLAHHPEIHAVYGSVRLALTTHDAGNHITSLDVALARRIQGIWERWG